MGVVCFCYPRADDDYTQWLSYTQLVDELKDEQAVKDCIAANEWEERPHELPTLAAQKQKQWQYTKKVIKEGTKVADTASVSIAAELRPEEYAEISGHMRDNLGKPAKKAKTVPTPENPEKKRRRDAISNRKTKLQKIKTLLDTIHNDLLNTRDSIRKLPSRGFPEQMMDFCWAKTTKFEEEEWNPIMTQYNSEAVRVISDQDNVAIIEGSASKFDMLLQMLQASWVGWSKTGGAELKKFLS